MNLMFTPLAVKGTKQSISTMPVKISPPTKCMFVDIDPYLVGRTNGF